MTQKMTLKAKEQKYTVTCSECKATRVVGYSMYRLIYPVGYSNKKNKIRGNKCLKCANKKTTETSFKKGFVPWNKGIGDKTSKLEKLRHSLSYRDWRSTVFKRDDYTCQECKTRGGILNSDHIKSFAHYPELRFDIDNGRTLCIECHRKTDNYGHKNVLLNKLTDNEIGL